MNEPAIVYVGWSGFPVRVFSFSQASAIQECGKKFELSKIQGYEAVPPRASLKFGIAVENAVTANLQAELDPVKKFEAEWEFWRDKKLSYGARDGDWSALMACGRGLMKEFLRAHKADFPELDGSACVFQKTIRYSQVNQGALWNGVDLECIADLIQPGEPLILDFKTSAASYPKPTEAGFNWVGWDQQLRVESMLTGIRNVGFLNFVKTKTPNVQYLRGRVTQPMVADIDAWLREQLLRVQRKEFSRQAGFRFPNQQCTWCDLAEVCLGDGAKALADGAVVRKQSKATDAAAQMSALDALDEL